MANATYGQIIYGDTVGILSKTPVRVMGINYYPNAVANAVALKFWDEANPTTSSELNITATASTGTVTDDDASHNYLTSTAFAAGSVVKVIGSSGDASNKTYHLVGTAGNNDRIIITPTATWADEANIMYHIIDYPARSFYNRLTSTATNTHESNYVYFGKYGVVLPNLILSALSASSYVQIFIASV